MKSKIIDRILDIVFTYKSGATFGQIEEIINDNPDDFWINERNLYVHLSMLASKGYLKNTGRKMCDSCKSRHTIYALGEQGKIRIGDRK